MYQNALDLQRGNYAQIVPDEIRIKHAGKGQSDELRSMLGSEFYSCQTKNSFIAEEGQ